MDGRDLSKSVISATLTGGISKVGSTAYSEGGLSPVDGDEDSVPELVRMDWRRCGNESDCILPSN